MCAEFGSIEEALDGYFGDLEKPAPLRQASLAVAGPVTNGCVEFTNSGWRVSAEHIRKTLGLERVALINDLEAVVRAWPYLAESDIEDVCASPKWNGHGKTSVVIGIGTGFGMSVVPNGNPTQVIATEAGHASFAPSTPWENEVLQTYWRRLGRVSVERLVSGRGLADLYQIIAQIENRQVRAQSASDIANRAGRGLDRIAKLSVRMFCELLGSVAGDCALVTGARAGVYLRGALVDRIAPTLKRSKFRERFEEKGRMRAYLQAVPTRRIVHPEPALLGAAAYAGGDGTTL